jgi:hypothetical protein
VRELFGECNIIPTKSSSGMRKAKNNTERVVIREVLITNYDIGADSTTPEPKTEQASLL